MKVTARATPNIAFVKYWGNRNDALRLPATNSLSMTLDSPTVEITIEHAPMFALLSYGEDGSEKQLKSEEVLRFESVLEVTRQYLGQLKATGFIPQSLNVTLHSRIPPRIGLASSAAVFGCFAKAIAGLVCDRIALSDRQVSAIARLGAGSAARSIFGGFAALITGSGNAIDAALSEQIADEKHWLLHDLIIVPSHDEKKIGSTEGHVLAHTSPHFAARVEAIERYRYRDCVDAILKRDFEKLQHVSEEDCRDMHRVMETSTPSLKYLTEDTHRIVRGITALRKSEHLPVFYTMDAGPTVHLICPDEAKANVLQFAKAQKGCRVYEAKVGEGAKLIG